MTWLSEKFPHSRILSLSYDAGPVQTPTSGRMDPYAVGESLLQQMLLPTVGIGQNDCPVVFVCHSLGGLIAKQIVVTANQRFQQDEEVQKLLCSINAFYFYATPHLGSKFADMAALVPFRAKGPMLSYLKVLNCNSARLNDEFKRIQRENDKYEWTFSVVAETHATLYGSFKEMVVEEASARLAGYRFLPIAADHFDVCKPRSKNDTSFQALTHVISTIIQNHKDTCQPLFLPDSLVGMPEMKATVCRVLQTESVLGLVGMGGIGKTTLSKYVYNVLQDTESYDKTCFLHDVRSRTLDSVQRQLLQGLCGLTLDHSRVVDESHLRSIRQCIETRNVLVVIDDVGTDAKILEALQVPAFKIGQNNSKVIITCRNWQVLANHVSQRGRLDMEGLDDIQAMNLFSYYAFRGCDEDERREYFQNLAVDIVKACSGLPLSLEVIGQYLRKQKSRPLEMRTEIWQEALKKLHHAEPLDGGDDINENLWRRLKISYDDLRDAEKSMFLDFACLFCEVISSIGFTYNDYYVGERSLGWIWDSQSGLQNLIDRSLIKIDRQNKRLVMHDQLRDMGRRVVKDMSMEGLQLKPFSRRVLKNMTRLWEAKDIQSFLQEDKSSTSLEGISLVSVRTISELVQSCKTQLKQQVPNEYYSSTRLLNLCENRPKVVKFFIGKCWKELHWLCLDGTYIHKRHIEVIGLCTSLRVLHMRYCHRLEELPTSIGNLVHLVELDLDNCGELRSLPESIGHLKRLKRLQLSKTLLNEVPPGVGQLYDLEYLGLKACRKLQRMCEFESKMDHLYHLDISWCGYLQTCFKSFGKLHRLRTLDLNGSKELMVEDLPGSLSQLSKLQYLNLQGCDKLVLNEAVMWDLSDTLCSQRLEELHLPAISQAGLPPCPKLKILGLENGLHLEELPASFGGLTQLDQLEELRLQDCNPPCWKKLPDSLMNLVRLKVLSLDGFGVLDELPECVGHLSSLQKLKMYKCDQLVELPKSLGKLYQLQSLEIVSESLERLPDSLGQLSQLQQLELRWCENLEGLPESLGQLSQLQGLVGGSSKWKRLPESLGQLSQLRSLSIQCAKNLELLPESLGQLSQLESLHMSDCNKLERLPGSLGQLSQLRSLSLICLETMDSLPDSLGQLPQLSHLDVRYGKHLERLPESLGRLSSLDFKGCFKLQLTEVGQQSLLRDLESRGCHITLPGRNFDLEHEE